MYCGYFHIYILNNQTSKQQQQHTRTHTHTYTHTKIEKRKKKRKKILLDSIENCLICLAIANHKDFNFKFLQNQSQDVEVIRGLSGETTM